MADPASSASPLSQDDAILILEQADLAAQARVPLPPGLRAMAAETRSFRVRRALREMADRLESGEELASVLKSVQPRLTPLLSAVIDQGVQFGRLDTILHWAAEQGRRVQNLHWQLWTALAYPLLLLNAAFLIGSFLLFRVTPMFKRIFEDFGTSLPELTKLIVMVSDLGAPMTFWVWGVLPQVVILTTIAVLFLYGNHLMHQRWSGAIPIIGPLFRRATLADFCHLLAVFVEVRMPLPKAMRLAGQAAGDKWLSGACGELSDELEAGLAGHHSAMAAGFPAAVAQLIAESSDPDAMAEALRGLGDIYATRAEVNSRFIAVIVEPFILIITAAGLGTIVVSLFLPLIKLLNDLS